MVLLTLNTHSHAEENYREKLCTFVKAIADIKPDIIALQEVNQSAGKTEVKNPPRFTPPDDKTVVKSDNHALCVINMLAEIGIEYYWSYKNIKKGYDIYDEGIAVLSKSRITEAVCFTVSREDNYNDWRTRKILGVRTKDYPDEIFFSVHYGWWKDKDSFAYQWLKTIENIRKYKSLWLMGDFNNPAEISGEGYSLVSASGFYDSYVNAKVKDSGVTVDRIIDGWQDRIKNTTGGMRIDQIWSSKPQKIKSHRVIFGGENYPVISDHYGIILKAENV